MVRSFDIAPATGDTGGMTRLGLIIAIVAAGIAPARAIVGGAPADPALKAHLVEVVSSHGACSGSVVGRNLVLTAGHCVDRPGAYAVLMREAGGPSVIEVDAVAIHPAWTRGDFARKKPAPDVALLRTRTALPARFAPLALSTTRGLPAAGTTLTLAGFGVAQEGNAKSAGVLRTVTVKVLLRYVTAQVKLEPLGASPAGACDLDSGGAALAIENGRTVLAGVIAWAIGAGGKSCGAASAITATGAIADWLPLAASQLGAPLGE